MKIRKTGMAAMISAAVLLAGTGGAMAYGNQEGKFQGRCDRQGPARILKRLDDVTDAQREQIEALVEARRGEMQGAKGEMREHRQAMRDAIERGASRDELRALADEQAARMSAMMLSRAETAQQVRGILTEAQREQLQEMRRQRMERHSGKKGMYGE
ncbi:MAG: Spy/CpxP family protein refolding chaperone [Gammaproteobacteria bacterium]|nr:Spy/CpxP family protein refolding chaperone [Gammaproteobacteria bacterium]